MGRSPGDVPCLAKGSRLQSASAAGKACRARSWSARRCAPTSTDSAGRGRSSGCLTSTGGPARPAAAGNRRASRPSCGVNPDTDPPEDRWCLAKARAAVSWRLVIPTIPTHFGPDRQPARGPGARGGARLKRPERNWSEPAPLAVTNTACQAAAPQRSRGNAASRVGPAPPNQARAWDRHCRSGPDEQGRTSPGRGSQAVRMGTAATFSMPQASRPGPGWSRTGRRL